MRFNFAFLALGLAVNVASAQQPAVQLPNRSTSAAAPVAASAQQAPAPSVSASAVGTQAKPEPGVVMLSDVAKQTPAEPLKIGAIQATSTDVKPIQVIDSNGKPLDLAATKKEGLSVQTGAAGVIRLTRIATVGTEKKAVLWVRGQQRPVASGSRVLTYTVGEIREDGVCLYPDGVKVSEKLKCKTFVTFTKGV